MNNVREIERINERELDLAVTGGASWHDDYKDSAYIFVGNLDKRLTEGDVIAIFSQYGEILDINLPRIPEGGLRRPGGSNGASNADDHNLTPEQRQQQQGGKPGERRGFGFLLYEDQRSTVLAVDNLNGYNLVGRTLRVDHVRDYKMPDAKRREEAGEEIGPSRNAAPQLVDGSSNASRARADGKDNDDEDTRDPMAAYLKRSKAADEDEGDADRKAEKRRRKEERRLIREERERRRAQRARGRSREERSRSDSREPEPRMRREDSRQYRRHDDDNRDHRRSRQDRDSPSPDERRRRYYDEEQRDGRRHRDEIPRSRHNHTNRRENDDRRYAERRS